MDGQTSLAIERRWYLFNNSVDPMSSTKTAGESESKNVRENEWLWEQSFWIRQWWKKWSEAGRNTTGSKGSNTGETVRLQLKDREREGIVRCRGTEQRRRSGFMRPNVNKSCRPDEQIFVNSVVSRWETHLRMAGDVSDQFKERYDRICGLSTYYSAPESYSSFHQGGVGALTGGG